MTLSELVRRLRERKISPREAVQSYLDRIELFDPMLNAYISVRAEEALAEADDLEGITQPGPLYGVPIAVKDLMDVAGCRTTAASKILAGNIARKDAFVVSQLRAAGAIIIGKLNLHEFAFGGLTTSLHYGPAHNPWAPDHICGGSSGGSGAAVAADLAAGTLGTDTGGSNPHPRRFLWRNRTKTHGWSRVNTRRYPTVLVVPHGLTLCHTAEDLRCCSKRSPDMTGPRLYI